MSQNSTCILACKILLCENMLAIRTYRDAIARHPGSPNKRQLERIFETHEKSAIELRTTLSKLGADPDESERSRLEPPSQEVLPKDGISQGPDVLNLLRREENTLEKCEDILRLPGLGKDAEECIRNTVIPRYQKNIAVLERLQASVLHELPAG